MRLRQTFAAIGLIACAKEPVAPDPAPRAAPARAPAPSPTAIPRDVERCADPNPPPCIYLGEGHCTLRQSDGVIEIPCPDWIHPEGDACAKVLQCHGYSVEGCCVGCGHPKRTRISPACARRIEAARECDAVNKAFETPGCAK